MFSIQVSHNVNLKKKFWKVKKDMGTGTGNSVLNPLNTGERIISAKILDKAHCTPRTYILNIYVRGIY